jgi:hypothetical protein
LPCRPKRAAGDDKWVAAVNLARCVRRQISAEYTVFTGDRQAPAGRAICPRDLFDNPD